MLKMSSFEGKYQIFVHLVNIFKMLIFGASIHKYVMFVTIRFVGICKKISYNAHIFYPD